MDHSIAEVRAAVFRETGKMHREHAVISLAKSEYPNRLRDLESLVSDQSQPEHLRQLAVVWISRSQAPGAADVLQRQLLCGSEAVCRRIVRAIGVIGSENAIPVLLEHCHSNIGVPDYELRFSVRLIQHRYRHNESIISPPMTYKLLVCKPDSSNQVRSARLAPDSAGQCLLEISVDPCGIYLNEDSATEIRVRHDRWLLFLNADLSSSTHDIDLKKHVFVLGVLAEWDRVGEKYFQTGILLTSPTADGSGAILHLHDFAGTLLAVGEAPCDTNGHLFSLQSVSDAAGVAFEFKGGIQHGLPVNINGTVSYIASRKLLAKSLSAKP